MDKSHNADGDIGGLGGDPAPHRCVVGGNVVGNGSCHGPLPGTSVSKGVEGVACDDGAWTTPVVAAETCGSLKENWHEGGEELARGQSCLGGLSDARRRKMMKACDSLPRPLWTVVPEPGGNETDGAKDGLEPANQCLEDSGGREEARGVGLEGDGVAGSRDQVGRHGAEEELGDDQGERGEARQEVEENVESQRCVGSRKSRARSATEQCQQQAPAPASFRPFASSGGRHKQARRRHHHHHHHNHHHQGKVRGHLGTRAMIACREFLSESLPPWCLSCFRMIVELIVLMAHQCGEFVEAGGKALYDSGSLFLSKAKDLPAVRSEARRLLGKAGTAGAVLLTWGLSLAKSGWQSGASCVCVVYRALLLLCGLTLGLVCRLGGERGRRWWTALLNSGVWKCTMVLLQTVQQKMQCLFKRNDLQVPPFNSEAAKGPGRCHPGKELERLLDLAHIPEDELDPFVVLGVEDNATDPELKRAYRQLAVQVHPDKNKHPRAGEAFKVLRAAWDIVSNPETYRQYQLKRMAESELSRSMNEFLTKLQDDLKEAMNTMMCTKCEGKHKRFEMERDPEEARFCAECNKHHSAEEGDFWAESSMLGLRITYFSFMDGRVYDITEWAGCQRISITPDTHRVPYHISFGAKSGSGTTRHRGPADQHPGPNSPADLQDFFNRIFQGRPPGGVAANGSFFPPGGGPPPAPSSHPGFFPSGGPRGDPGESRTESSRPVRRRKKVRKPFQW